MLGYNSDGELLGLKDGYNDGILLGILLRFKGGPKKDGDKDG